MCLGVIDEQEVSSTLPVCSVTESSYNLLLPRLRSSSYNTAASVALLREIQDMYFLRESGLY